MKRWSAVILVFWFKDISSAVWIRKKKKNNYQLQWICNRNLDHWTSLNQNTRMTALHPFILHYQMLEIVQIQVKKRYLFKCKTVFISYYGIKFKTKKIVFHTHKSQLSVCKWFFSNKILRFVVFRWQELFFVIFKKKKYVAN